MRNRAWMMALGRLKMRFVLPPCGPDLNQHVLPVLQDDVHLLSVTCNCNPWTEAVGFGLVVTHRSPIQRLAVPECMPGP